MVVLNLDTRFLLLCALVLVCSAVQGRSNNGNCEPIDAFVRENMCQGISYNMTIFPNILKHTNKNEAAMEMHQFYPLIKVNCSPSLSTFLCAVYFPPCSAVETPLPPCASVCRKAKDGCLPLMHKYSFDWPRKLECQKFPESGLCVGSEHAEPERPQSVTESMPVPGRNLTVSPAPDTRHHHHHTAGRSDNGNCEPIDAFVKENICQGLSYNMTIFPNVLKHTTQKDAELEMHQFIPLIKVNCSSSLIPFLCAVYFPPCSVVEKPIPPCASTCSKARDGCLPLMNRYGVGWPEHLECRKFPESGLCVGSEHSERSQSVTESMPVQGRNLTVSSAPDTGHHHQTADSFRHHETCGRVRYDICQDILPYNLTRLPNVLNHKNLYDAEVDFTQYFYFFEEKCSPYLIPFICASHFPQCPTSREQTPVLPCASLCRKAMDVCGPVMRKYGFVMPEALACHRLPESGPCFGLEDLDGNRPGTDLTTAFTLVPDEMPAVWNEMLQATMLNPFMKLINSSTSLAEAQEKLAVEQTLVAKLMKKKLNLEIRKLRREKPKVEVAKRRG